MNHPVLQLVTIGVYGSTEEGFFRALLDAGVDTFCDIRARRGVRGHLYPYANAQRLQEKLEGLGIRYLHFKELAAPPALRERQKAEDHRTHTKRRERSKLDETFVTAYRESVLASYPFEDFFAALPPDARVVALFCVERAPEACHRSIVAQHLSDQFGYPVNHLYPS